MTRDDYRKLRGIGKKTVQKHAATHKACGKAEPKATVAARLEASVTAVKAKKADTAERIIQAIGESNGLLTLAASKAGVSYRTIERYVKEFPEVAEAVQHAKETMLDYAESKLYGLMREGNVVSILFFLKTQGKPRGYIERVETTGKDGAPLIGKDVRDMSDEELAVLIAERTIKNARKRIDSQASHTPAVTTSES